MADADLDYILIGPAYPYRGGISDTQHQLAKSLQNQGKKIQLITFKKLYPKLLFPGKSQFSNESAPKNLTIEKQIHAFNPLRWKRIARQINQLNPKQVVFRYYTPFLAMAYGRIAKSLQPAIKKIALVDNWSPHESTLWDGLLNRYFGQQMDGFTTLSDNVARQLQRQFTKPVWKGFHPIAEDLLPALDKGIARKKMKWSPQKKVVLFYGLIRKYKGLDLLISAFAEKELYDQNIVLYVAGECYEDTKKYTTLVKQLQLEDRIFFDFHFQSPTETQQLFSAADVVAQTYYSATQSGVTPLAYFYDTPLLVSDINGLRTPVVKDNTGICCQKESTSIAKALATILQEENILKFKSNLSKSRNKYRWSTFANNWSLFIEKKIKK